MNDSAAKHSMMEGEQGESFMLQENIIYALFLHLVFLSFHHRSIWDAPIQLLKIYIFHIISSDCVGVFDLVVICLFVLFFSVNVQCEHICMHHYCSHM